jgi:hypothetical protein
LLIVIIAGYAIWAVYDLVPLYKQKFWHDFWTDIMLGLFSFTFAILLNTNIKIPSIEKPIRILITSIFGK